MREYNTILFIFIHKSIKIFKFFNKNYSEKIIFKTNGSLGNRKINVFIIIEIGLYFTYFFTNLNLNLSTRINNQKVEHCQLEGKIINII